MLSRHCSPIYVCIHNCIRLRQSQLIRVVCAVPSRVISNNVAPNQHIAIQANATPPNSVGLPLFRPFFFFSILLFILFSFKLNCYICRRLIYCEDVSAAHIPEHLVPVPRTILLISLFPEYESNRMEGKQRICDTILCVRNVRVLLTHQRNRQNICVLGIDR